MAAARISRKLFPTTTPTNQTDCSACPYDCPFDCLEFPDFYFPPPPPPPHNHQTQPLQPLIVVIIALSVGFFFAINFYILAVKCRGSRNSTAEASQSDAGDGELLDRNQVDHPIWFITTVGLQQSIINAITVCKFKKGEGLIEGTECSVCLSEFQEDEMLRLLPKCSHAFHIGCVDTWLRSHTTCPLCRAHILTDLAARPPNLGSVNQSEANLGGIEETQMENGEINGEVVGENHGVGSVSGGSFDNRGEVVDEQGEVVVQVGEIVPKEGIFESDESIGNFEVEGNGTLRNNLMDSSSESAECEGRSVKIAT